MSSFSEQLLKITTEYIGPTSKMFLERQCRAHLNGLDFNAIDRSNAADLAKWVNISAGLLIGKDRAQELSNRIQKL